MEVRRRPRLALLVAALLAALWLLLAAAPAHAQEAEATETPAAAETPPAGFDFGGWARELLEKLPPGISEGVRSALDEAGPALWDEISPDLPGLLARGLLLGLGLVAQWWMEGLDPQVAGEALRSSLLVQTPPAWTYANPDVQAMQAEVKTVAVALLAPAVALAGLGVYFRVTDPESVLRGAVVAVAGVFGAEHVGRWLLDFGNALALVFLGGAQGLPGWAAMKATADAAVAPSAEQAAVNAGAAVVVFALAAGLMLAAAVLHALGTAALYLFLPLCAACYALPFLQRFAKAALFALAVAAVVKAPGVVVLRVGSAAVGRAVGEGGDAASVVFAVVATWGVCLCYSLFLAKGAMFAGGNLLADGQRAGRTVVRAVREPSQVLRYRDAQRQEHRLAAGSAGGAGAIDGGRPTMITHAHTHGHLVNREPPAPTVAGAPAGPPKGTNTSTRSK